MQFGSPHSNRRWFLKRSLGLTLVLPWAANAVLEPTSSPAADTALIRDLESLLRPFLQEHGLPAIAAAVSQRGQLIAQGVVGVRKLGDPPKATIQDKFHIGSCTKAMTSTLAAILVERGTLKWESTLADVFPERGARIRPDFGSVPLEWLLTHRSGARPNSSDYGAPAVSVTEQRLAYTDSVIMNPPLHKPGTVYEYSNAGYIIAGTMLERATGQSWEALMQEFIFKPLAMNSAGFGPPSKPDQTDQPWGHIWANDKFKPRYGDNPRALGPAGTVHCSVVDYLKFADLHLSRGARPRRILPAAAFDKLHQAPPNQEYAFGWMVVQRPWAKGIALTHAGSNTMNYFVTWLAPGIDLAMAVAINAAGDSVPKYIDDVAAALVREFCG